MLFNSKTNFQILQLQGDRLNSFRSSIYHKTMLYRQQLNNQKTIKRKELGIFYQIFVILKILKIETQ